MLGLLALRPPTCCASLVVARSQPQGGTGSDEVPEERPSIQRLAVDEVGSGAPAGTVITRSLAAHRGLSERVASGRYRLSSGSGALWRIDPGTEGPCLDPTRRG